METELILNDKGKVVGLKTTEISGKGKEIIQEFVCIPKRDVVSFLDGIFAYERDSKFFGFPRGNGALKSRLCRLAGRKDAVTTLNLDKLEL